MIALFLYSTTWNMAELIDSRKTILFSENSKTKPNDVTECYFSFERGMFENMSINAKGVHSEHNNKL